MPELRVFRAGDDEPTDVAEVRHTSSQRFQSCVTIDLVAGVEVSRSQCWTDGGGDPLTWSDLTRRLGTCTLTEVADLDQGALTMITGDAEGTRPAVQDRRGETITRPPVVRDAEKLSGDLRARTITWFAAALKTIGTSAFTNLVEVGAEWAFEDVARELTDAVFADAAFVAGWTPPGDAEWGVDRGAVFSLHDDAAEATEVFSRCLGNGVRARLLRRNVGPWEQVSK